MSLSPFQLVAPDLRAKGYSVIPLAPGSKYPALDRWSEFCTRLPDDTEHARWMDWKAANAGLCLGAASGVMALDFDDDVDGLHARILSLVPESPVAKRGAKGFTAFYRFTGQRSHGYSVRGVRVLDVLSQGRQTVLPPSLHPAGGAYQWVTPRTLADVAADELPEITPEAMQAVVALFRPEPVRAPAVTYNEPYREAGAEDIREALRHIPADDYDLWIRMGMALRQHLGDRGLAIWEQWSATSPKYVASETPKKWRSFRRTDITIASLFYTAMDYGYIPASRFPERADLPRIEILEGGNLRPRTENTVESLAFEPTPPAIPRTPGADILNPPGLVGQIARWINATSIYPQPVLAVAASVACVGVAMAHKVQSPTRLRTNFYMMGLAPSGAGKDHARDCVTTLLIRSGLESLVSGIPASGAGLLTSLREGGGRCLIQWDEFGRVLKNLTHKNAGSHQRDILTYLIELFSSAKSMYAGVQYANHDGKMKRTPIDQPCLSVYATTVPERFFQSLTSDDAIDGFLARWMVLESKDYTLKPAVPSGDVNDPPDDLLDALRRWKEAPSNYDPKGNIDGVLRIHPMTVSYSAEAEAMIDRYSERMRRRAAEESANRTGLAAIFARCAEHAIKLALVAHEGDQIGGDAMRWAIQLTDFCAAYMVDAIKQNVAESEYERTLNKVLSAVRSAGGEWIDSARLINRTRSLRFRERNEVLAALIESGEVERREITSSTKTAYQYRAAR